MTLIAGLAPAGARMTLAQSAMARVGLIATTPVLIQAFKDGLRDLGYVEGETVRVEQRSVPGGSEDQARTVIADLTQHGVAVIVATASHNVKAAMERASVPIVAIDMESDPVTSGLVKSLAHPGGKLTGFYLDLPELSGKQIQLLRETLGPVPRIGVIWDDRIGLPQFEALSAAAKATSVLIKSLPMHRPEDADSLFASGAKSGAKAIVLLTAPLILQNRERLAATALRYRLPTISVFTLVAEAGGLIGYGPDFPAIFRRSATYVDRILRGTQPADLPIERPTRFELVINLRTAKALGLTIPPSLLLRVDRVIN